MNYEERLQDLLDELDLFQDWTERYEYIISLGKKLPRLDEAYKTEDSLIKGCQSRVWLHTEPDNGVLKLYADSDSLITKGLIAVFIRLLSGLPPEEILKADMSKLLSAFCGASLSCSSSSRDITIRSIPSGASLRVNGDYAGQAPVTLSLNRHKPVHVAADKPGFLSTEKTFYPEMTTQGAILWGRNNEKSKDFKTDILTIRLKKADSGAPPLRELPAQW